MDIVIFHAQDIQTPIQYLVKNLAAVEPSKKIHYFLKTSGYARNVVKQDLDKAFLSKKT
jgi:hypothetical protein